MLTLFSTTKSFDNPHIKIIQTNAIASWRHISPKIEILLFGNYRELKKISSKASAIHLKSVLTDSIGFPYVNKLFYQSEKNATNQILCYVNADILMPKNILRAIEVCEKSFDNFLLVGKRYDLEIKKKLGPYTNAIEKKLVKEVEKNGKLRGGGWIDYVIFKKGQYNNIPPFMLGTPFWDKWLLWHTYQKSIPIVDCTDFCTVIHQVHDYSHHPQGTKGVWESSLAKRNLTIAGGWHHGLSIDDADYEILRTGKLKKKVFLIPRVVTINIRRFLNIPSLQNSLLRIRRLKNTI